MKSPWSHKTTQKFIKSLPHFECTLWLFHSGNGLICTHANERKGFGWRDRLGGEKRETADWLGPSEEIRKHTWISSTFVSQKTMLFWIICLTGVSSGCSDADSYSSAKITTSLCSLHIVWWETDYHNAQTVFRQFELVLTHDQVFFLHWFWLKYTQANVIYVWKGESIK